MCLSVQTNCIQQDQYSRRDNLLFDNIAKSENEGCSKVIRRILIGHLGFSVESANSITFIRCHRLGKPREGSYHYFSDRESVWKKRSFMKGSNARLSEDFPKELQLCKVDTQQVTDNITAYYGKNNARTIMKQSLMEKFSQNSLLWVFI